MIIQKYKRMAEIKNSENNDLRCMNLHKLWQEFKGIILDSAKEVFGTTNIGGKIKRTSWWSNEIKEEIKLKKTKWQEYLRKKKTIINTKYKGTQKL